MNYPLDYGSGSFCWLYLTGDSCLLFQEFSCVFPQKSLSFCRCTPCWADPGVQTGGSPVRSDGLSNTTGSVCRGNCISEPCDSSGEGYLLLSAFFPQLYLHHTTVPLLHIYVLLITSKAEATINCIKCWDNTWVVLLVAFSPVYQCFSFICSLFNQFNEDSSGLFSGTSVSWPGIGVKQYKK